MSASYTGVSHKIHNTSLEKSMKTSLWKVTRAMKSWQFHSADTYLENSGLVEPFPFKDPIYHPWKQCICHAEAPPAQIHSGNNLYIHTFLLGIPSRQKLIVCFVLDLDPAFWFLFVQSARHFTSFLPWIRPPEEATSWQFFSDVCTRNFNDLTRAGLLFPALEFWECRANPSQVGLYGRHYIFEIWYGHDKLRLGDLSHTWYHETCTGHSAEVLWQIHWNILNRKHFGVMRKLQQMHHSNALQPVRWNKLFFHCHWDWAILSDMNAESFMHCRGANY